MSTLVLQGNTLGEKHRHYNKLVKEAIETNQELRQSNFNNGEDDIEKLLNIDVASENKNVEYILEVLKSEDMLCVSKAIKKSVWLITNQQYTHIINPEYLNTYLFPQMITKAVLKFKKHIRLHLKDETRGVQFYKNEKDIKEAVKWLPVCPLDFIEDEVKKHSEILKPRLLKRLCEKSIKILETDSETMAGSRKERLEATKFLLNHNAEKYLDLVEKGSRYEYPKFGIKSTDLLMKKCPERIFNKFELYCQNFHMATFAKYIKTEDAKKFLYNQIMKEGNICIPRAFFNLACLRHVINRIPEHDRFEFVNNVFINVIHTDNDTDKATEKYAMRKLYYTCIRTPAYKFYEFAPFDIAFNEIIKLISTEACLDKKNALLEVLVTHVDNSVRNTQMLLEYYRGKHSNDPQMHRITFASKIISVTDFHRFDETTWNILNDLFKGLNVYVDSSDTQKFRLAIESIIIYEVIRDKKPPEIIEKLFDFNTLRMFLKRLNRNEKDKVFNYLYNYKYSQLQNVMINNEAEFKSVVDSLNEMLNLLVDWNKGLNDYPWVLDKLKQLSQIKRNEQYSINMSFIYNKTKSWKKHMFHESLTLHPSPEVCVNILKHGSQLLTLNESIVQELCRNDRVILTGFLKKLRIYWSETIASKTANSYLGRLAELGGHKALIRGLCALLPRHQFNEIIQKYVPQQAEIDWGKIDELELSLQRHIAKNMHYARPQPHADAILGYTKGDYLQYALPSLLAIFYNINASCAREHIPKLLNAPVSVQKHGIRLAYNKLPADELHQLFSENWTKTKNNTIRSITFKYTFDLLCNETDTEKIKGMWKSLATFMDCLTYEEDKNIYKLLTNIEKVPLEVRPAFFMKSYDFLKRLIPNLSEQDKDQYKQKLQQYTKYARELVEYLPSDFVEKIIQEYIHEKYLKTEPYMSNETIDLITSYLLCANNLTQNERYQKILKPLIQLSFNSWHKMEDTDYYVRKKFQFLLDTFRNDLEYVVNKRVNMPIELYSNIENDLSTLPVAENYIMITKWKLTVELAKILNETNNYNWSETCSKACTEFGDICLKRLKEDVDAYFPCIYLLFTKILEDILQKFTSDFKWQVYKRLAEDDKCIQAYLAIIKAFPKYVSTEEKQNAEELRKILWAHTSVEVKMHCYHKFKNEEIC